MAHGPRRPLLLLLVLLLPLWSRPLERSPPINLLLQVYWPALTWSGVFAQVRLLGGVLHLRHLVRGQGAGCRRTNPRELRRSPQGLRVSAVEAAPLGGLGGELPVMPGQGKERGAVQSVSCVRTRVRRRVLLIESVCLPSSLPAPPGLHEPPGRSTSRGEHGLGDADSHRRRTGPSSSPSDAEHPLPPAIVFPNSAWRCICSRSLTR